MALSESWQQDVYAAEQLGQEIMELINERNSLLRTGSNTARVQSNIRIKMTDFSSSMKQLKGQLMRATTSITVRELERRQNQVDNLTSKEKQFNEAFKPTGGNNVSRNGLFNDGFERSSSDVLNNQTYNDVTPGSYQQQQQQIMQEQDKGLEALSEVIQRQKLLGKTIGNELDYHNDLIDDIQDHVDTTNQKLIRTEGHVKKVTKKSGSCALIAVVILLLVAIVVVAVVPT